jgi:hypothetical protein
LRKTTGFTGIIGRESVDDSIKKVYSKIMVKGKRIFPEYYSLTYFVRI